MTDPARHVLFITGEYPPQTGGVGAYTAELAAALVDLGEQASILTLSAVPPAEQPSPVAVYPVVEKWDRRIWKLVPAWAERIGAGLLHVQYQTAAYRMNPAINFAPAALASRRLPGRLDLSRPAAALSLPQGGRAAAALCDRASRRTRRPYDRHQRGRPPATGQRGARSAGQLARIPIGSNIPARDVTAQERMAYRRSLGYGPDDFVLAYFGFLNRSKGGLTLIETLHCVRRDLPQARLLMIGERVGASDPTNYAYLQEVEAQIAAHGLTEQVQWTGHLDAGEVGLALAAADILLMPYADGASLRRGTLMAGLGQGCVLVTTQPQAPLPELLDGRDLLYVPPADSAAAAAAVLRLARDPALAQQLAHHARVAARQFRWEEIARRHVALYDILVDANAR